MICLPNSHVCVNVSATELVSRGHKYGSVSADMTARPPPGWKEWRRTCFARCTRLLECSYSHLNGLLLCLFATVIVPQTLQRCMKND
jgi:hypothetical protein